MNEMVEIQERNEVLFTFAQIICNGTVWTAHFINIFNAALGLKTEATHTRIPKHLINAFLCGVSLYRAATKRFQLCFDPTEVVPVGFNFLAQGIQLILDVGIISSVCRSDIFQYKGQHSEYGIRAFRALCRSRSHNGIIAVNHCVETTDNIRQLLKNRTNLCKSHRCCRVLCFGFNSFDICLNGCFQNSQFISIRLEINLRIHLCRNSLQRHK